MPHVATQTCASVFTNNHSDPIFSPAAPLLPIVMQKPFLLIRCQSVRQLNTVLSGRINLPSLQACSESKTHTHTHKYHIAATEGNQTP